MLEVTRRTRLHAGLLLARGTIIGRRAAPPPPLTHLEPLEIESNNNVSFYEMFPDFRVIWEVADDINDYGFV